MVTDPTIARPHTYYSASLANDVAWPVLQGDHSADVVVIGGGFTGVNTALELAERGFSVVLVEANRVGWGQSGRNGGQVTGSLSGEGELRRQWKRRLGAELDDFIWWLRWHGQDVIAARVARHGIDCDLKHGHIHAAMKPSHMAELEDTFAQGCARGMGDDVVLLDAAGMRDHLESPLYCGGLLNSRNMHLHPLKLCLGEAQAAERLGVRIFEGSPVLDVVHGPRPQVVTAQGRVTANQVMIAGDVTHKLERKRLSGMIFPAVGGIVTTEPLGEAAQAINPHDLAVYDCRFVLDYYRLTADGRLLFGGGANYSGRESRSFAEELRPAIEATFPRLKGVKIDHAWSCAMGIVINRAPQLGKLASNVWYAQGYSGHGVATSHVVAEVMAEAIAGTMERFDVFAALKPVRLPLGDLLGNPLLTLGMRWYLLLEKFR
ncbi:FAD-binding oxidoreductase [Novosphingobium sp. SG720]|uniref:NAD(P)/FAD-dependent oxidoreductase n=1 Tax=Novosphingobium sp. SG720 TaxID=2586998 RepID=UPI001447E354|nr:FAD-binding oxidoreductase [Novosphingobium sp. SG720]NKJ42545.1 glycine/D-amino acid oxidase-like deaminating enzyme [Novosphingobium sp. SG720]